MICFTLQQALMTCTHFVSENNETTRENIPLNEIYIGISAGEIHGKIITFIDSIRPMKSIGLIKCDVDVHTNEGQLYMF